MSGITLSSLMKDVGEALRLDNENNETEAYKKYVGCIHAIASNLVSALKAKDGEVVVDKTLFKQVKLAQQCTERLVDIVTLLEKSTHTEVTPVYHPYQDQANTSSTATVSANKESNKLNPFSAPVPALPPENNPYALVTRKSRCLTPMEIASKQNQSLMKAYRARMQRLNRSDFNAYTYSLTMQRKMIENITIAKAQEEELARKMELRNLRLEQEAAKRFTSPIGMSEEEKEQRNIYMNILQYENEAHFLKDWREKLTKRPDDPVLICQLVQEVLRCSDHPITELLKQYQFKIYQRLFPLVEKWTPELDRIKVPLADNLWPPLADVRDIIGGLGAGLESQRDEESFTNSAFKKLANGQVDETSSDNITIDTETSDASEYPKNNMDKDRLQNERITSHDNQITDSGESLRKVYSSKDSILVSRSVSTERRQAKLLMEQVSQRFSLDGNAAEEDLDHLYDDDDGEAVYDSIDSAAGLDVRNIQTGPSKSKSFDASVSNVNSFQNEETENITRSVSHDVRKGSDSICMSDRPFQSLPPSSSSHELEELKDKKFERLSQEAYERHLESICEDIHRYLDKLLVLMTIAYGPLDTPVGRDQCAVSLEEPFFKPIWKTLLKLFRVVNLKQERVLAAVMTRYSSATPGDLSVNKKLWLTKDSEGLSTSNDEKDGEVSNLSSLSIDGRERSTAALVENNASRPYQSVIDELRRVADHYTMLNKLECAVKVCRLICECVDDFYKPTEQNDKKAPSVGADDLLPILCYSLVHSALPQLGAECHAMAEFIHEGYLMGEEGYCLTTLRTALHYLSSLYGKT